MKLSIVIPMYNEERYIGRCLHSLLEQTIKPYEIILIDDGSTDNTILKVKTYQNMYPNIKLYLQQHKGPGVARNFGAKKAKGDILIFVDADMLFHKDYLKYLIKPIIEGKEFGTTHGTERVANLHNVWARSWSIDRMPNPPKRTAVFRAILKKKFLEKGGFDSSKGYFDDDLSHIGSGLVVKKAICYHNNPETLKEAFKHSIWVGSSIYKTGTFKYYLKRLLPILILSLCSFIIILNLKISLSRKIFIPIIVICCMLYIDIIYKSIKQGYPSHLIFMPIMWITRLLGYTKGFLKEKYKNQ